jgi:hypothetical protein
LGLLTGIIFNLFLGPWLAKKSEAVMNKNNHNIIISIGKVHVSLISSVIEFDSIKIDPRSNNGNELYLKGLIGTVRIKGFNILKFVLNKKINLKSVTISNTNLKGIIPFTKETKSPLIIPGNIAINSLVFDEADLYFSSASNSLSYSIKKGAIKVYDLHLIKNDTLSGEIINQIDFEAKEFRSVTADSMNSSLLRNLRYSSYSKILSADSFCIHPNYTDYEYASMYKFQKDRIETELSNIKAFNINAADFIRSGKISSSYIEIGNLKMNVFRDKRKEFRHINKPTFQDIIYSCPGYLRLDSISILNGNITYKEHAEKANDQGYIEFNKIIARIYNITNDTIYRSNKAFLELRCNAMLMGKSKINILLKSRIF